MKTDDQFEFPPGMRPAREWAQGQSFIESDIAAIQRDAVLAARREARAKIVAVLRPLQNWLAEWAPPLTDEQKAANNAAWKEAHRA